MLKWQYVSYKYTEKDGNFLSQNEKESKNLTVCRLMWHKNVDQLHKHIRRGRQDLLEDHSLSLIMCCVVSESRAQQYCRDGLPILQPFWSPIFNGLQHPQWYSQRFCLCPFCIILTVFNVECKKKKIELSSKKIKFIFKFSFKHVLPLVKIFLDVW